MFTTVLSCVESILDFQADVPFEKVKYAISRMNASNYSDTFNIIVEQPHINNPIFSIYTQDFFDNKLKFVTSFMEEDRIFPFNLDITNVNIVMNCLSAESLNSFCDNLDRKYIYLPIIYKNDTKNSGHIGIVTMDTSTMRAYLMDPNGSPSYFDDVMNQNISDQIESMLTNYFDLMGFEFVPSKIWNKDKIVLNRHFNNANIGSGHCAILSIITAHLINILNVEPGELFYALSQFTDEEMLYLIKEYSSGLYGIMKDDKSFRYVDDVYRMYEKAKVVMPDMDIEYFNKILNDAHNQDKWNYKKNIGKMFGITV